MRIFGNIGCVLILTNLGQSAFAVVNVSVSKPAGFQVDTTPVGPTGSRSSDEVRSDSDAVEAPALKMKAQENAIDCSRLQTIASNSDVEGCLEAKSAYSPKCHIVCPTVLADRSKEMPRGISPEQPIKTSDEPRAIIQKAQKPRTNLPATPPKKKTEETADGNGVDDGGTDTSKTSSSESADLRQCNSLRASAESACNYQDDSDSASDSNGLSSTCQQGTSKGLKNSQAKTKAANDCSTKFAQCKQTCGEFADTYSESDNFDTFNSNARACLALASKATALNDSSSSSYDFAQSSLNCQNNSSESPQSAGGGSNGKSPDGQRSAANDAACAANPNAPGCSSAQTQGIQAAEAAGGFGDASKAKGSPDVADTSENFHSPFGDAGEERSPPSAPARNATVANNSGGSIPGGGGGGAKASGGGLLQSAVNAVNSAVTAIEKGFLGGGYSSPTAAEKTEEMNEASPYGSAVMNRGMASDGGLRKGTDLRRYLPGGDLGPRKPLPVEIRDQFHGPGADIFEKIHIRYELKCRLGELYDCRL